MSQIGFNHASQNAINLHLEILHAAKKQDLLLLGDVVERHILNASRVLLAV